MSINNYATINGFVHDKQYSKRSLLILLNANSKYWKILVKVIHSAESIFEDNGMEWNWHARIELGTKFQVSMPIYMYNLWLFAYFIL